MAVNIADLTFAIEWLSDGFEADDEESYHDKASLKRVAQWLEEEIQKRETAMLARELQKRTGAPIAACRKAARKVKGT